MRFLVALVGGLLGGLLGLVGGVAVSVGFLLMTYLTENGRGAPAQSLISLLLTVPGGFLFGVFQGVRFAISRFDRHQRDSWQQMEE